MAMQAHLVRHIYLQICPLGAVLLHGYASPAIGILVDLVLDHFRSICNKDGRIHVARGHLSTFSLQGGEESGLDERRLLVSDPWSHIACHAKVRILVYCAGNEARNVHTVLEEVRKRVGERGSRLYGWKPNFTDVILPLKAKDATSLVEGDTLRNPHHVLRQQEAPEAAPVRCGLQDGVAPKTAPVLART
eukprot:scaffold3051_cov419-Prasinococcus_capsulatus_cf.AAC.6